MHQPALLSLLLLTALLLLSATASDPHENIRFEYCQQGTSYTAAPRHLQPAFSHGRALARLLCASPSAYKQRRPLSSRFTRSKRSPRSPQERPCSLGGTLRCVRDTRGTGDARWWRALTARPSCRSRGLQRHCAHRGLLPQPAAGVWRHVLNVRLHDLPAA